MCYINIYLVTRNQVSLQIKAKVFDFFPLVCYEKKAETFLSINVKRAKNQITSRFARYPKKLISPDKGRFYRHVAT